MKDLFKNRSLTACMKASYDLMISRFGSLLKTTWWTVLAYAVLTALYCYLRVPNKELHDWGEESSVTSFFLQTVILLLMAISGILANSAVWSWINKRSLLWNFKRYFVVIIIIEILAFILGVSGMFGASTPPNNTVTDVIIPLVSLVLFFVVLLPFGYIVPRLMLLKDNERLMLWKSFVTGLRHSGGIFMLGFLGSIIISIIAFIIALPAIILCGAQTIAQLGALDGDALGIPSYFTPLLLVVLAAVVFIFYYMGAWLGISYAYLYGSYVAQNNEKQQLEENKQITSY